MHESIAGEDDLAIRIGAGRCSGASADRDEKFSAGDRSPTAGFFNLQRVRIEKGTFAVNERDIISSQLLLDDAGLIADHTSNGGEKLLSGGPSVVGGELD